MTLQEVINAVHMDDLSEDMTHALPRGVEVRTVKDAVEFAIKHGWEDRLK